MRKYIIGNVDENFYNAASKARRDAETIARDCGYEPIPYSDTVTADGSILLQVKMALSCIVNGTKMIISAEKGSMILLQHPQFPVKSSYFLRMLIPIGKRIKGLKFAALVHDLDSLRGLCGHTGIFLDRNLLPSMDAVICHNGVMKCYLKSLGIKGKTIITLGLFDYMTADVDIRRHNLADGIAIAGNLDPKKCSYIDGVKLPLHLYGKGREDFPENMTYHGAFAPEELPVIIEGAFGLVWDGNDVNCCGGDAGNYLRYNNPHKLSLYLVSGMPVIVWRESAAARLVVKYGLGIVIDSLNEIETALYTLNEDDYQKMLRNVRAFSGKSSLPFPYK